MQKKFVNEVEHLHNMIIYVKGNKENTEKRNKEMKRQYQEKMMKLRDIRHYEEKKLKLKYEEKMTKLKYEENKMKMQTSREYEERKMKMKAIKQQEECKMKIKDIDKHLDKLKYKTNLI